MDGAHASVQLLSCHPFDSSAIPASCMAARLGYLANSYHRPPCRAPSNHPGTCWLLLAVPPPASQPSAGPPLPVSALARQSAVDTSNEPHKGQPLYGSMCHLQCALSAAIVMAAARLLPGWYMVVLGQLLSGSSCVTHTDCACI